MSIENEYEKAKYGGNAFRTVAQQSRKKIKGDNANIRVDY
jgi:hypothetical protein